MLVYVKSHRAPGCVGREDVRGEKAEGRTAQWVRRSDEREEETDDDSRMEIPRPKGHEKDDPVTFILGFCFWNWPSVLLCLNSQLADMRSLRGLLVNTSDLFGSRCARLQVLYEMCRRAREHKRYTQVSISVRAISKAAECVSAFPGLDKHDYDLPRQIHKHIRVTH